MTRVNNTRVMVGLILAITSFLPKSEANGQSCPNMCTLTSDYCQSIPQYGIFLCVSTQVPQAFACSTSCSTAVCHYIHLRNVTGCASPRINKFEITVTKDSSSSQFSICHPLSQWGQSPWTSEWSITKNGMSVSTNTCYNWGGSSQITFVFTPPSGTSPDYTITDLNHWMVTICGGSAYTINAYHDNNTTYCNFINPTITSTVCPPSCP